MDRVNLFHKFCYIPNRSQCKLLPLLVLRKPIHKNQTVYIVSDNFAGHVFCSKGTILFCSYLLPTNVTVTSSCL